jgi:hypothetical protein
MKCVEIGLVKMVFEKIPENLVCLKEAFATTQLRAGSGVQDHLHFPMFLALTQYTIS